MQNRTAMLGLIVSAGLVFPSVADSIGFSSQEGYTSGPANNQQGILSQANVQIDASGAGQLEIGAVGFQRALLFSGRADADVSNLAAGETLVLVATGVTIDRPAANLPTLVFGLTDSVDVGKSVVKLGGQLRLNQAGDVLLDQQAYEPIAPVDTGIDVGQTFDFRVEIVKNNNGTFDVTSIVGGLSMLTADNVSIVSTTGLFVQSQGRGKDSPGTVTIEMVSIGEPPVTEAPEPE